MSADAADAALAARLVALGRRLARHGLVTAAEGNLSVRLGGRGFLVTPAGRPKGELAPADLVRLDTAGRPAAGTPSSEWPLHAAIYAARPDVGAVCHAHPPHATAFAVAERPLDGTLLTETADLLPRVPVAPRARPGSAELAAAVAPLLADHDAVLLAHHGAVAVGPDLDAAGMLLEALERLAQVTWLAAALRPAPPQPPA